HARHPTLLGHQPQRPHRRLSGGYHPARRSQGGERLSEERWDDEEPTHESEPVGAEPDYDYGPAEHYPPPEAGVEPHGPGHDYEYDEPEYGDGGEYEEEPAHAPQAAVRSEPAG